LVFDRLGCTRVEGTKVSEKKEKNWGTGPHARGKASGGIMLAREGDGVGGRRCFLRPQALGQIMGKRNSPAVQGLKRIDPKNTRGDSAGGK